MFWYYPDILNLKCLFSADQCVKGYFACGTGQCVPQKFVCDGDLDCLSNGKDELDCLPRNCSANEFRCKNGRCIPNASVCDHLDDCRDMSDEICR